MAYEYKCVAGPTVVSVRKARERQNGVKAFEDIMNREAADGWEFVTVDEFHTSEPESWLSRKRIYVSSKMLVFRKLKPEPVVAHVQETMIAFTPKPKPATVAPTPAPAVQPPAPVATQPASAPEIVAERIGALPEKATT